MDVSLDTVEDTYPSHAGNGHTHAIVIGASIAGLLATRVLSDHFERVTLIERDPVNDQPEARKGQPQARHLHALLSRGVAILTARFPDLRDALVQEGALVVDPAQSMRWYCQGGYRMRCESGLQGLIVSRPCLEWYIRQRVVGRGNVTLLDACRVEGLRANANSEWITGVQIVHNQQRSEQLAADLVVDASGRGSASPRWLADLGYSRPHETEVRVRVGYASRFYRRDLSASDSEDWFFCTPDGPHASRGGGAFPLEHQRWQVTLAGWSGDYPPDDETDFLAFARSLPAPDVYNLITHNEPLSEIVLHRFPSSLRRHYEHMPRFPQGYLVLGDAVCSFNPVYGQGMTSAALQADELDSVLQEYADAQDTLAVRFFERIAKVIDVPWQMAINADFRFPGTEGQKARATDLLNLYTAMVDRATRHDALVCRTLLEVINLTRPPAHLFSPHIMARVLWFQRAKRKTGGQ